MIKTNNFRINLNRFLLVLILLLTSCAPAVDPFSQIPGLDGNAQDLTIVPTPTQRPYYSPGELVDYFAQTGDTLPALASHFNTTVEEILAANPEVPITASTMPPGFQMRIPIYFVPLWGPSYKIIPDSAFVYGPSSMDDQLENVIAQSNGWLKNYSEPRLDGQMNTAQILTEVSQHFSISPKVLLTFLELQTRGLSNPNKPDSPYYFGYETESHQGLYLQTVWLANQLNNAYYGWRNGSFKEFEFPDGRIERPDPWLNASTVAIHYALSRLVSQEEYSLLVEQGGFDQIYNSLFGNPWLNETPHIPVSLQQPYLVLPFEAGRVWNYTGGPHAGWGNGLPFAAIDFAPSGISGCNPSDDWVTAMAGGLILRSQRGEVWIDLDMDGNQQTGWVLFYLHLSNTDRIPVGAIVNQGDRIGHPSCEGGTSTGTHVHVARLYNGEWIIADSPIPFDLDGWVVQSAGTAYKGSLKKHSDEVRSSTKAERFSAIEVQTLDQ